MNDILIRLREPKVIDPARGVMRQASALECEAADEIERLRSQHSKSWPSEPTEAMLQDGARAYEHHLDHARPGPHTQAEAMSAAWMAIMSHLSQPHKPGGEKVVAFGAQHCGDPLCDLCCPDDLIQPPSEDSR